MRYPAIFLLLTLVWNPSHARALPGQETGAAPQAAPQDLIQMPQGNIIWAMEFPLRSSYLLQTRNSLPRHVAKGWGGRWS